MPLNPLRPLRVVSSLSREYCEKIGHHELQTARAEEERRILQEELWRQPKDFREVHQQSLTEMEEL